LKKKISLSLIMTILILFTFPKTSEARLRDYISVKKGLTVTTEYNDNRYLKPEDKEGGFEVRVHPAIALELNVPLPAPIIKISRHHLELSYDPGFPHITYSDGKFFDKPTHKFLGLYRFSPSPKFSLSLRDEITRDNKVSVLDPLGDYTERTYYTLHTAIPSIRYNPSPKLGIDLGYQYSSLDYGTVDYSDTEDQHLFVNFDYTFSPRTSMIISYRNLKHTYQESKDKIFSSNEFGLEITRNLTQKVGGIIGVGYEMRQAAEAANAGDEVTGKLELNYKPTERTQINLGGGVDLGTSARQDRSYKSKNTGLTITRNLTPKISLKLDDNYRINSYHDSERKDDLTSLGLSLEYKITKRMTSSFGYSWRKRDSNDDQYDYTNNVSTFSISMEF